MLYSGTLSWGFEAGGDKMEEAGGEANKGTSPSGAASFFISSFFFQLHSFPLPFFRWKPNPFLAPWATA